MWYDDFSPTRRPTQVHPHNCCNIFSHEDELSLFADIFGYQWCCIIFVKQTTSFKLKIFHEISWICGCWLKDYITYVFPSFKVRLTHWGRVTHICASKLTNIGSYNGSSPGRRQAIIWRNAGISLVGPFETNFSENLIRIQTLSFKKMPLKMSSAKWRPFCLGLNVLTPHTPHPTNPTPDSGREKHPFFTEIADLNSNKTPLFQAKCDFIFTT